MTTAWILGSVSLLATTIGALLILLYLCNSPLSAEAWQSPERKAAYPKYRRGLITGVGLLAAWLLIQYLAVILL